LDGLEKATRVEILVERAEVLGQIETLGVLRCAQDDGKNLNSNDNGYCNCNCNGNSNCNGNGNGYCYCYCYGDGDGNCYCYCNGNGDGNGNGYGRFRSPLISNPDNWLIANPGRQD
jgi:hypothetical protein